MADIGIANCTINRGNVLGGFEVVTVTTPATADSADTVDLTSVLGGRSIKNAFGWNVSDGITATVAVDASTDVATIDAAGGLTNNSYVITLLL